MIYEAKEDRAVPAILENFFLSNFKITPEELLRKMYGYFLVPEKSYQEIIHEEDGTTRIIEKTQSRGIPLWTEFLRSVGMTVKDLERLAEGDENIRRLIETCNGVIKEDLIRSGLSGAYNAQFATFVAVNLTDMKMKTVTENTNVNVNVNSVLDEIEKRNRRMTEAMTVKPENDLAETMTKETVNEKPIPDYDANENGY